MPRSPFLLCSLSISCPPGTLASVPSPWNPRSHSARLRVYKASWSLAASTHFLVPIHHPQTFRSPLPSVLELSPLTRLAGCGAFSFQDPEGLCFFMSKTPKYFVSQLELLRTGRLSIFFVHFAFLFTSNFLFEPQYSVISAHTQVQQTLLVIYPEFGTAEKRCQITGLFFHQDPLWAIHTPHTALCSITPMVITHFPSLETGFCSELLLQFWSMR